MSVPMLFELKDIRAAFEMAETITNEGVFWHTRNDDNVAVPATKWGLCDTFTVCIHQLEPDFQVLVGEDVENDSGFAKYCFNNGVETIPLSKYILSWEKYSGNPKYPVPSVTEGKDSREDYRHHLTTNTLWEGESGNLRRQLLKHFQTCLSS